MRNWPPKRQVVVAFVALTLAYVAGLVWMTALNGRTHTLAKRNQALLIQFEKFRHKRAFETTRSDFLLCGAVNKITKRDRATVAAGPEAAAPFLKLLGVSPEKIKAFESVQKAQVQKELARRPLLKCGSLPTSTSKSAPAKLP